MNIEHETSNDSWGLLDVGRSVSAAQHHNGMNVGLLVNDGDRFGAAVNAVSPALPEPGRAPALHEPAGISLFTPQDTLLLQVLDLEYALRLKAQSVAAKSQGQYKAETFLLSPGELARFSSDSVKLQVLQHRMHQLDLAERDLDRTRRQPAGIIESAIDLPQAVQPAERDLDRPIIDLPPAVQPAEI